MDKTKHLEDQLREQGYTYCSFKENLGRALAPTEIDSMHVLGKEFFVLVEQLAAEIFLNRQSDSLMLQLNLQDYHFELQVFTNFYLRNMCSSVFMVKSFSASLLKQLADNDTLADFMLDMMIAYEDYFFVQASHGASLV